MSGPRRLVEENELLARLVADARRREPPPEALSALMVAIDSAPIARAPSRAVSTRSWGWLTIAGASGLAILTFFAVERSMERREPLSAPTQATATATATATSAPLTEPAPEVIPSVAIADLPDSRGVAAPPRTVPPAPSSSAKGSRRRELELITRAREALTKGDSQECLAAIAAHDAEFPKGQLAPEAMVMRIEAMRASGDRPGALALARAYLQKNPDSPYAARVRSLIASLEAQ